MSIFSNRYEKEIFILEATIDEKNKRIECLESKLSAESARADTYSDFYSNIKGGELAKLHDYKISKLNEYISELRNENKDIRHELDSYVKICEALIKEVYYYNDRCISSSTDGTFYCDLHSKPERRLKIPDKIDVKRFDRGLENITFPNNWDKDKIIIQVPKGSNIEIKEQ